MPHLAEMGVNEILKEIKIFMIFTELEKQLLYQELYNIFRQNEISEAVRLVEYL